MRIDLHTHSSVSDGTDTPTELVANARAAGLDVVALCDHDTFDGLAEAVQAGTELGVQVLRGIEISAEHDGTSVHLLGYGCRADDGPLNDELAKIREGRTERVPTMLRRLAEAGMPVPEEVLAKYVGDSPSVGRPHLADSMIELGYVADRREAFDNWLADDRPIFVQRYSVPLAQGLDLVRAAGGVAVIAHPWGRVSRDQLPVEVLAGFAAASRLDGVEVDHQDHDAATRAELRALASRLGLLATGASDYHGTGKVDHDLGCNTTDPAVLTEIAARVAERGGVL
ncbi:PHP domain-containing protein [Propionicimonas sp.]|uniref:PHP domain-containing protein n=1 Tax=Propionicimonas sp. TaxID=1955623 RepID=UPI0039E3A2A1